MLVPARWGLSVCCVSGKQAAAPGHHEPPGLPTLPTQLSALPTQVQHVAMIYYGYYYKTMDFKTPSTQRKPVGSRLHTLSLPRGQQGRCNLSLTKARCRSWLLFAARWNTIPTSLAINGNHTGAGKSFNSYGQHKKQRKPGRPLPREGSAYRISTKPASEGRLSGQLRLYATSQPGGAQVHVLQPPLNTRKRSNPGLRHRSSRGVVAACQPLSLPRCSLAQNLWHRV